MKSYTKLAKSGEESLAAPATDTYRSYPACRALPKGNLRYHALGN